MKHSAVFAIALLLGITSTVFLAQRAPIKTHSTEAVKHSVASGLKATASRVAFQRTSAEQQSENQDDPFGSDPVNGTSGERQQATKALPLLGLVGLSSLVASFLTRPRG